MAQAGHTQGSDATRGLSNEAQRCRRPQHSYPCMQGQSASHSESVQSAYLVISTMRPKAVNGARQAAPSTAAAPTTTRVVGSATPHLRNEQAQQPVSVCMRSCSCVAPCACLSLTAGWSAQLTANDNSHASQLTQQQYTMATAASKGVLFVLLTCSPQSAP